MRKSGEAGQFVSRSDIVGDAERYRRRGMIFREHNTQTVLQRVLLDGNFYFLRRRASRHCREDQGCDPQHYCKPGRWEDSETLHIALRPKVISADTLSYFQ